MDVADNLETLCIVLKKMILDLVEIRKEDSDDSKR